VHASIHTIYQKNIQTAILNWITKLYLHVQHKHDTIVTHGNVKCNKKRPDIPEIHAQAIQNLQDVTIIYYLQNLKRDLQQWQNNNLPVRKYRATATHMALLCSSGSNLLHCSIRWFVLAFHLSVSDLSSSTSFCSESLWATASRHSSCSGISSLSNCFACHKHKCHNSHHHHHQTLRSAPTGVWCFFNYHVLFDSTLCRVAQLL